MHGWTFAGDDASNLLLHGLRDTARCPRAGCAPRNVVLMLRPRRIAETDKAEPSHLVIRRTHCAAPRCDCGLSISSQSSAYNLTIVSVSCKAFLISELLSCLVASRLLLGGCAN